MRARKPNPSDLPEDFVIEELRRSGRLIDEVREQPRLELPLPSYEILPPRHGEPVVSDMPVPGSTVIILDM